MSRVVLNARELLYLTNIFNIKKLEGVDKFNDIKEYELNKIFADAKVSLNLKKYISINQKNQISMDICIYLLLNTCSAPEQFMSFEKIEKNSELIKYNFYFYESVCIKMIDKKDIDEYIFIFIVGKEKIKKELNLINIEDFSLNIKYE